MTHRYNPYIVGSPVEGDDFYGRETLLDKIWGRPDKITHLLGMRRVGKTSVLRKLAIMGQALYLDLQEVGDWAEFGRVLQAELNAAKAKFPWLPLAELNQTTDWFEWLKLLDKYIDQAGGHLWLLFDEAEILIELGQQNISALRKLQSFLRRLKALQVVFASAKRLTELDTLTANSPGYGSPFLNEFPPPLYLGGLDDQAALALIRQSQNPPSLPVSDEIAQAICRYTHNHPYFIQWVCYHLWEQNPNATAWRIDENTFKISPELQRILKNDFEYLSDPERRVIWASLNQQPWSKPDQPYVEGLTLLGYLRQTSNGYEIGNNFFKDWLLQLETESWAKASLISAEATLNLYEKTAKGHDDAL